MLLSGGEAPPSLYIVNASVHIIMAWNLLSHARNISISIVIHEPVASQHMSIQMGEATPFILAMQGCPTRLSRKSTSTINFASSPLLSQLL